MFRFDQAQLQSEEIINWGRFGTVFPYQKDPQDRKWVVKKITAEDPEALVASLPEIIFACDHPHILSMKGYSIEKNPDGEGYNLYMKLPRMKETLLDNFKRRRDKTPYSEEEIIRHFYSLVCGVEYFHSKKIFHGDIQPDNLLLDDNRILKIRDIGITKHGEEDLEERFDQIVTRLIEANFYSSPEIMHSKVEKEQLLKADVWSLGVVVLELCTFDYQPLDSALPQDELQDKVRELFGSLKGKFQKRFVDLMRKLVSLAPKERPSIGQIKAELEENFGAYLNPDEKVNWVQKVIKNPYLKIAGAALLLSYLFQKGYEKSVFQKQKTEKVQGPRESFGEYYELNLKLVTLDLKTKWEPTFLIQQYSKMLVIRSSGEVELTDENVSMLSKDIIERVSKNNLLNLEGLQLSFGKAEQLTDQAIMAMTKTFCSLTRLEFLSFDFNSNSKVTIEALLNLATEVGKSCQSLKTVHVNLTNCPQITKKHLNELRKKFPSMKSINVHPSPSL